MSLAVPSMHEYWVWAPKGGKSTDLQKLRLGKVLLPVPAYGERPQRIFMRRAKQATAFFNRSKAFSIDERACQQWDVDQVDFIDFVDEHCIWRLRDDEYLLFSWAQDNSAGRQRYVEASRFQRIEAPYRKTAYAPDMPYPLPEIDPDWASRRLPDGGPRIWVPAGADEPEVPKRRRGGPLDGQEGLL